MNNLWLKVKVWSKLVLFVLGAAYLLLFFLNNSGQSVRLWVFFGHEYPAIPLLLLVFVTFAVGVVIMLLIGTIRNTIRQVRELRQRGRAAKLERDMADMKAKAGRLQTRPEGPSQEKEEGV
jgi:uncharacterized integral membrane protein